MPTRASQNHHPDTFKRRGGALMPPHTAGVRVLLEDLPALGSVVQFDFRSRSTGPITANGQVFGHGFGFHGGRDDGHASLSPSEPWVGVLVFGVDNVSADRDAPPTRTINNVSEDYNQTFTFIRAESIKRFWDDSDGTWYDYCE